MESTNNNNNNNNQLFLCEIKELRKELSAMKKRIVQLENSHEEQQERLVVLERENHVLKTQLIINGNKEAGSELKRKRTDQEKDNEEEMESNSTPVSSSAGKKKTKTNNNNDDDEVALTPRRDNGDSFESLSDDLLHKIVEFDGNCYEKFGSINKRCRNIYDVKEYKLKKQTCVFGYGTVDMMLQHYLQKKREDELGFSELFKIARAVIWYNRLDAIDWIIQLEDSSLLRFVCSSAASLGRINILKNVFCKCNLTMLDALLVNNAALCYDASSSGQLKTLKCLRKYGADWDVGTFGAAKLRGHDEIVQYLRYEGCPEFDSDESLVSEQVGSDDEDGDN